MERTPVESTSLRSVGYDEAREELEVEFTSGRVYRYAGVPAATYAWLMRSPGKGGLFNRLIRDRYPMRDVTPAGARSDAPADLEASLRASLQRGDADLE